MVDSEQQSSRMTLWYSTYKIILGASCGAFWAVHGWSGKTKSVETKQDTEESGE